MLRKRNCRLSPEKGKKQANFIAPFLECFWKVQISKYWEAAASFVLQLVHHLDAAHKGDDLHRFLSVFPIIVCPLTKTQNGFKLQKKEIKFVSDEKNSQALFDSRDVCRENIFCSRFAIKVWVKKIFVFSALEGVSKTKAHWQLPDRSKPFSVLALRPTAQKSPNHCRDHLSFVQPSCKHT